MSGANIPPVNPAQIRPPAQQGQVVELQTLPEALQSVSRPVRLEGEVIRQNDNGSVRVRTAQGDIDINVRGRQPQEGQRIEVDIPAGSPPRNATIRPAPVIPQQPLPQQPPVQSEPLPPQPTVPLPQTPVTKPAPQPATQLPAPSQGGNAPAPTTPPSLPPVITTKPVPVVENGKPQIIPGGTYQPSVQPPLATATPALPLNAGQIIRLVAATEQDAVIPKNPVMAPITPETTITGKIGQIMSQVGLGAQKTQGAMMTSLIQAVKSALITPAITTPVATIGTPPAVTATTGTITPAQPIGQTILPDGSVKTILPVSTGTSFILPVDGDGSPSPSTPIQLVQLDAKIMTIKLPTGQIIAAVPDSDGSIVKAAPVGNISVPIKPDGTPAEGKPVPVAAIVTGFTRQNFPVITIPLLNSTQPQNFVLQFPVPHLQEGSQFILIPQTAVPAPGTLLPPAFKSLLPLLQPSLLWPAADDIYQAFFQTTPQAGQIMARILPTPSNAANLAPSALLFAAALKSGELQNWLGEKKFDMLQKLGKESLLSRLGGEASPLTRAADAGGNDWRSFPIPLLWQNEISKVLLHVKQENEQSDRENKEGGTRFIFDLALTRMGDVQLDGMVRDKRLDIIIRTQTAISYPMQEAMKKAYADALDGTDIFGEITFQGDLKQWMHVVKGDETMSVST